MIDELRALQDAITAAGVPAHIGQVPGATDSKVPMPPYVSLSAPGFGLPGDVAVFEDGSTFAADVRMGVTETTESNAYVTLSMLRRVLTPNLGPSRLDVPGRYVTLQWVRSEFVGTDRDVTYAETNRHPAWGVDTYRIESQPA